MLFCLFINKYTSAFNTNIIADVVGQILLIQGTNIKNSVATTKVVIGLLLSRYQNYIKPTPLFHILSESNLFTLTHYIQVKKGSLDPNGKCICSV